MIMRFSSSDFLYKGICCGYSFELHRQVDAIQMSTLNICLYKEVDKKYTGCNLKTTELLDCALIGICEVIRSNTVCFSYFSMKTCCRCSLEVPPWSVSNEYQQCMMRTVEKKPLCHMRTAKINMSVRIRAIWPGHSLCVDIYYTIHWFCKRATKALNSLRKCAGWSGPTLSANYIRAFFVHCA